MVRGVGGATLKREEEQRSRKQYRGRGTTQGGRPQGGGAQASVSHLREPSTSWTGSQQLPNPGSRHGSQAWLTGTTGAKVRWWVGSSRPSFLPLTGNHSSPEPPAHRAHLWVVMQQDMWLLEWPREVRTSEHSGLCGSPGLELSTFAQ